MFALAGDAAAGRVPADGGVRRVPRPSSEGRGRCEARGGGNSSRKAVQLHFCTKLPALIV